MAELQAVFHLDVAKNMEKKRKPKILTFLKKATFPVSLRQVSMIRTTRTGISW